MPIVFSEGITMRSFPALILQSCQIDPLWPAEEVGAASPNSATPDLRFSFQSKPRKDRFQTAGNWGSDKNPLCRRGRWIRAV